MNTEAINFSDKFKKLNEFWSPRVIAEMNDYQFKIAKFKNEFVWHDHKKTDEAFIVIKGSMFIEFEGHEIELKQGEMHVVPKGVRHKTFASEECHVLLIEPRGVINTGDTGGDLTANNDVWI